MACVQTILQQFDQFLLNGSHMLLCQAEIHFFISPCCTSDAMLSKAAWISLYQFTVPSAGAWSITPYSPQYSGAFIFWHIRSPERKLRQKADSHVCNACPSEDLCCMIRHMIILYCFSYSATVIGYSVWKPFGIKSCQYADWCVKSCGS